MYRFIRVALCLMIALLIPASLASAEDNMIVNGDFSQTEAGSPASWRKDMWFTDEGVSLLTVEEDGYEGACVSVSNIAANDARFAQTVEVEPDTIYRLTCMARAEGIDPESRGASISIGGTFSYSNEIFDTQGEWQELAITGRTGRDQTELTVFLRVGGYSGENAGRAWFDDVEMVRLDKAPKGVEVLSFEPVSSSKGGDDNVSEEGEPARSTETWVLMALLWALAVVAVARKTGRSREREPRVYTGWFIAIMLLGLVVRLILAARVPGYNTDINCFSSWAGHMLSVGPLRFYQDIWCDYPPLYMWMLAPIAWLIDAFRLAGRSGAWLIVLKSWPMLFDLGAAALVFFCAKRRHGGRAALVLSALILFNPAVFVDSAAWGQIDSIFTLLAALSALDLEEERYPRSLVLFALAMLVKPQALLFAPVGLAALVIALIRQPSKKGLLGALGGMLAAIGILYVFGMISQGGLSRGVLGPFEWIRSQYIDTLNGYEYVTINALNLYYLFDLNWAQLASHGTVTMIAWACFAAAYAFAIALLCMRRQKRSLVLAGAALIVLVCTFGPMIHERYAYPAILLLVLSYVEYRDRRILIALTVLSVTLFLNETLVLQGGMTAANYGHLQSAEDWLNKPVALASVLNALFLGWTALDICAFGHVRAFEPAQIEEITPEQRAFENTYDYRMHLKPRDVLLILAVTVAYAFVGFYKLGTTLAPQTTWTSAAAGETVTFDLGEVQKFRMNYYGNICSSNFTVEFSNDGEEWTQPYYALYDQGQIFRWLRYKPLDENGNNASGETVETTDGSVFVAYSGYEGETYPYQTARYVRITAVSPGLKLMEVGFVSENGFVLQVPGVVGSDTASLLIDEQNTIPSRPSYFNSSYFDEIYHPRTAYEHLHGLSTYETTHPPLGKVMMMIGIAVFGMSPFGWRFMGALMGVMMLPVMYLMVKQLTKSTKLSFFAMFLLAVDSMHFTQTRLATIDSYAVFWIMLMYLFMFRFIQMPWHTRRGFRRSLIPLGLCGISMGLGWATKWICLYASVGLAILFFWTLWRHYRAYRAAKSGQIENAREAARIFPASAVKTLAFCLVFFVLIPAAIYYFSYYWHLQYYGVHRFTDMLSLDRVKEIWKQQLGMYNYHAGLGGDTHPFRSAWYQWPLINWPMWYYSGTEYLPSGKVASISCMGNPLVWWFSIAAFAFITVRAAWMRRAPRRYLAVLIGFASQFLPWVLVPRSTFIYHYFASVPFIITASALALEWLRGRPRKALPSLAVVLGSAVIVMIVGFSPLITLIEQCLRYPGDASFTAFAIRALIGLPFVAIAVLMLVGWLRVRGMNGFMVVAAGLAVTALIAFIAFFPLESGRPVARSYAAYLKWFNWVNF